MTNYQMPKGVEHVEATKKIKDLIGMTNYQMPKGVEHQKGKRVTTQTAFV